MIGPPTRRPTSARAAMLAARRQAYATRQPLRVATAQPKGIDVYLARWSTVLLAMLLASPALYHGFIVRDLDTSAALTRFLIAVPVSAVMIAVLRTMTSGYQRPAPRHSRGANETGHGAQHAATTPLAPPAEGPTTQETPS